VVAEIFTLMSRDEARRVRLGSLAPGFELEFDI